MLNARDHRDFPAGKGDLTAAFTVTASRAATENLGRRFAETVRRLRALSLEQQRPVRLGFIGAPGAGKTPFVRGMKNELEGYNVIERNCRRRPQYLWQHQDPAKGWIRYYDGYVMAYPELLSSYISGDMSRFDMPFLDFVENPSTDKHDKLFDCLIFVQRADIKNDPLLRHFAFVATEQIRALPEYEGFTKNMEKSAPDEMAPTALRAAKPI